MIYVCAECGSSKVETKYWANINTLEISTPCEDNSYLGDPDSNWCINYEEFVNIKEMEEIKEITCPECGSDCIVDYEGPYIPNENEDIEYETLYSYHCTNCGYDF